jgi:hypothetical protein
VEPDERSEIRELPERVNEDPGFCYAHPGYCLGHRAAAPPLARNRRLMVLIYIKESSEAR